MLTGFDGTTGVMGIIMCTGLMCTVFLEVTTIFELYSFWAVITAMLVTFLPATNAVGVTKSCNTALVPLASVPTFHIPVVLL